MSIMAKEGDRFALTYDLFSLPTAQHKAGLAGLLLLIDSLRGRRIEPIPYVEELTSTGARIAFNLGELQTLFDDLFDAVLVEVPSRKKRKQKNESGQTVEMEPKRVEQKEEDVDGKKRLTPVYIYEELRPKGAFLQYYYPDGDALLLKLWRDMVWSTLRGVPLTRLVYAKRADGAHSPAALEFWTSLEKSLEKQRRGIILTESLSSSLLIGAEDANAERVSFQGPAADKFLLHMWPVVSLIHVPRKWSLDKAKDGSLGVSRKEAGFVLSIPEPADLSQFREDARIVLRRLDPEPSGFRPRSALIDVHEEAGLEYLYHFANRATKGQGDYTLSLCALELFHLQKQGNRIRQLAVERVLPQKNVLRDYELVRKKYWNPLFKAVILRNLLDGKPWYYHFDLPLHQHRFDLFLPRQGRAVQRMIFFGQDVRRMFESIKVQLERDTKGGIMDEQNQDNRLSMRVYRMVQTYVNLRTEEKSGRKFKDFSKDSKGHILYPPEYREAREKVCTDAFLAMRGRRDQEFIGYFTGTICSVPQYLNQEEYTAVAGALMTDWERIKTLSMLALSAHSYLSGNSENEEVR